MNSPSVLKSNVELTLPPTSHFLVVFNQSLAMRDLSRLSAQGYSVVRSAHAGNLGIANQIVADSGISFLMHEHLAANEPTYSPGHIRLQNGVTQLCPPSDRLALWQSISDQPMIARRYSSPVHMHLSESKRMWPNVFGLSELVLSMGKDLVSDLLDRFLNIDPRVAHAYVDRHGNKSTLSNLAEIREGAVIERALIRSLLRNHFEMISQSLLNNERPADTVLPDTASLIVLTTVAELLNTKNMYMSDGSRDAEVYHLAGSQMVNYLIHNSRESGTYLRRIDALYQAACAIEPRLPEKLILHLVPTQHLNDISCFGDRKRAAELFALAQYYSELQSQLRFEMKHRLVEYRSHAANICSYEDFESLLMFASQRLPLLAQRLEQEPTKCSRDAFIRSPDKAISRLMGAIAGSLSSEAIGGIKKNIRATSSLIRQLKTPDRFDLRVSSQYSSMTDTRRAPVPEIFLELTPPAFSELGGIITRA